MGFGVPNYLLEVAIESLPVLPARQGKNLLVLIDDNDDRQRSNLFD